MSASECIQTASLIQGAVNGSWPAAIALSVIFVAVCAWAMFK